VEAYLALEFRPTKVHELVTEGSSLEESFLELTPQADSASPHRSAGSCPPRPVGGDRPPRLPLV
jgi:hypothetical protein